MRTVRILVLTAATLGLTVAAAPALAGGGGGGGPCPAFTHGTTTEIVLEDFCIAPISADVAAGGTLTVRNAGQQPHTLTAIDGSFDTGILQPGETTTLELPAGPADLPVYCTLHADTQGHGMAGILHLDTTPPGLATTAATDQDGRSLAGLALIAGLGLGAGTTTLARRRTAQATRQPTTPDGA